MRLRHLATALAGTSAILALSLGTQTVWRSAAVPNSLAEVFDWQPSPIWVPVAPEKSMLAIKYSWLEPTIVVPRQVPLALQPIETALSATETPVAKWSSTLSAGETLDAVLSKAGLSSKDRAEVASALSAEYDLRRLLPGHEIEVVSSLSGVLRRVTLTMNDGVMIEGTFEDEIVTRKFAAQPDLVQRAAETTVRNTVFASLSAAGVPPRFAVDVAKMLGGTVDFRRELRGGEKLQLMWHETRIGDKVVGQPNLTFAAITIDETLFEIIWPDDRSGRATIFVDGELLKVIAQPVIGAQLSSVYGKRKHPVFGDIRMHTGVDFTAPHGTPVYATAAGRIAFIGRRGGYGRVVEIAHGSDTLTRYAHLSAVPKGVDVGDRVAAGDMIGRVGATGTATGPNLHYEVLVNGNPTDPMTQDQLVAEASEPDHFKDFQLRLESVREQFLGLLNQDFAAAKKERL